MKEMIAIVTVPPYAPFIQEVANHPIVTGLRLNTVMPVKGPLDDLLCRLRDLADEKPLWIDLKGRQLRTVGYATPPFTEIKISHSISVKTPVTAYFGNGREYAKLVAVDGDRLMFLEGPRRVVGPGESVNIIDPSLVVQGYLTKTDLEYVHAARKIGLHNYMLSYFESEADGAELMKHDDDAVVVAKIESKKGMNYVGEDHKGNSRTRLMAARGDLYIEVDRPHQILAALELIVEKDENAIAASRIFSSMAESPEPSCQDITDLAYLLKIGYRTFMLGDEVCLRRESVLGALNLLEAITDKAK